MRKIVAIVLAFWVIGFVVAQDSKPWTDTPYGSWRVERFWEQYEQTYVLVSYRNTTNNTYNLAVTLRVTLYDSDQNMLLTNDRSFYGREMLITPGFEGTLKFPFDIAGKARYCKVAIIAAQSL